MSSTPTTVPAGPPSQGPGSRQCCLLAANVGFVWDYVIEVKDIRHQYGWGGPASLTNKDGNPETLGLIYTCAGGFIDLGHVNDLIDLTRYYYQQMKENGFRRIPLFGYAGQVRFTAFPSDPLEVARSIAYDQSVFHEIETYWVLNMGAHPSSFSPEDLVSNMVGTYIGAEAIKAGGDFDVAAQEIAQRVITDLGALNRQGTLEAFKDAASRGWFSGSTLDILYLKHRNFNYQQIVPWILAPSQCTGAETWPSYLPQQFSRATQSLYEMTFDIKFADFEYQDAVRIGLQATSIKNSDFAQKIDDIKKDARARYNNPNFDQP